MKKRMTGLLAALLLIGVGVEAAGDPAAGASSAGTAAALKLKAPPAAAPVLPSGVLPDFTFKIPVTLHKLHPFVTSFTVVVQVGTGPDVGMGGWSKSWKSYVGQGFLEAPIPKNGEYNGTVTVPVYADCPHSPECKGEDKRTEAKYWRATVYLNFSDGKGSGYSTPTPDEAGDWDDIASYVGNAVIALEGTID